MGAMTWSDAARYYNWLSEQERIREQEWCYLPNDVQRLDPKMRARENFIELFGYQLPTEAEREFACQAGAKTPRFYRQSDSRLQKYAWYQANTDNHTWPVGSLKPNDFGLFDMHGNVMKWCHDSLSNDPAEPTETPDDVPRNDPASESVPRILSGGEFYNLPMNVRSPCRSSPISRANRIPIYNFRTCRSFEASGTPPAEAHSTTADRAKSGI